MICDNNFVMQTCVALMSLRQNKAAETICDVYIIMADCSTESQKSFEKLEREDFLIHIIKSTLSQYSVIKQLAHISIAGLLKFDICNLVPQYDKILYLDGDIIVRGDLRKLYQTDVADNYVACVVHSLGIVSHEMKMNSGIMLLNAVKIRNDGMRDILFQTREELGDRRSMDQETFNIVFADKKLYLPPKYNVMLDKVDYERKYYTLKKYNAFYGTDYSRRADIINTAVIIHFTGGMKPWKYTFAKCVREWEKYYELMFGNIEILQRKGRIAYLKEVMGKDGMRGVYWILKDKFLAFIGALFCFFPDKSHGDWN